MVLSSATLPREEEIVKTIMSFRQKFPGAEIKSIISTCGLMGYPCVISSLNPGIISALVSLDIDTTGIISTLDLDQAFSALD